MSVNSGKVRKLLEYVHDIYSCKETYLKTTYKMHSKVKCKRVLSAVLFNIM